MDKHTISYIIIQHFLGQITESEQLVLNEWLAIPGNRELFEKVNDTIYLNDALSKLHSFVIDMESCREAVWEKIKHNNKIHYLRTGLKIAASILVVLSIGSYFWFNYKKESPKKAITNVKEEKLKPDVAPGPSKATLTLADGSQIVLDSAGQGQIAQQGGTAVINNKDGQLAYNVMDKSSRAGNKLYNTLKTEKGQTYSVKLPDGSRVWLNAASSIKYPVAFNNKERRVTITGEAFFEVEKLSQNNGERVPFIVKVEDSAGKTSQEVQVLGTQFNINAYKEEKDVATTLLEGKVRINNEKNIILDKPRQQGVLSKGTGALAIVKNANVEKIVAWKSGFFYFERDSLSTVIKQIAKWYDVEYVIDRRLSNKTFSGMIQRSMLLSQVLEKVSLTSGLPFDILHGKRLTIRLRP